MAQSERTGWCRARAHRVVVFCLLEGRPDAEEELRLHGEVELARPGGEEHGAQERPRRNRKMAVAETDIKRNAALMPGFTMSTGGKKVKCPVLPCLLGKMPGM